jgi:hypothetical protein
MHTSAQWGRLLIMKMLVDEFDDDAEAMTSNGRNPLHVAAAFGQVRRLRIVCACCCWDSCA